MGVKANTHRGGIRLRGKCHRPDVDREHRAARHRANVPEAERNVMSYCRSTRTAGRRALRRPAIAGDSPPDIARDLRILPGACGTRDGQEGRDAERREQQMLAIERHVGDVRGPLLCSTSGS